LASQFSLEDAKVRPMTNATVLIADDDPDFVQLLARRCEALGLRILTASDGLDALMSVVRDAPDLLILDISMPGGDGLSVAEKLLRDPRMRPTPVIFCSGRADAETQERCKALGGHFVTKGAELWANLWPIIANVLGIGDGHSSAAPTAAASPQWRTEAPGKLAKVLLVDDDEDVLRIMQIRLRACGIEVMTASSAMQGLWLAMKEMPQVIVTDYRMPEGSGDYLIARLRAVPALKAIPVIVLTGASGGTNRDYALERRFLGEYGVSAFLSKPLKFEALLEALARHIELDATIWRKASALRQR
jgi:two-component system, NtrC family, sensor kinase